MTNRNKIKLILASAVLALASFASPSYAADDNYLVFDTICGATQERQDALFEMLTAPMDVLLVVGGYNSSNTSHLVEIGQDQLPSFFIQDADCLTSLETIALFDLEQKEEIQSE